MLPPPLGMQPCQQIAPTVCPRGPGAHSSIDFSIKIDLLVILKNKLYKYDPYKFPDSKVHGTNMGPIWGWQDPGGPHVGPMNLAIWDFACHKGCDVVVYVTIQSLLLISISIKIKILFLSNLNFQGKLTCDLYISYFASSMGNPHILQVSTCSQPA